MNDLQIGLALILGGLLCLIGGFWLGTWGSIAGFIGGSFFIVGSAYVHSAKVV